MTPHPLSQEILNRWNSVPSEQKADPLAAIVRIAVEVTREWMQHYPEGIAEFLKFGHGQLPKRMHS